MAISFKRVPTVASGQPIKSSQYNTLAESFNQRINYNIGDPAYRIFWYTHSLFRNMRNREGENQFAPSDEWWKIYATVANTSYKWPLAEAEGEGGINVSNPLGAFVFGAGDINGEANRLVVSSLKTNTEIANDNTISQIKENCWAAAKIQRGYASPAYPYIISSPVYQSARIIANYTYPASAPYLKSYTSHLPQPAATTNEMCPKSGDYEAVYKYKRTFIPLRPGLPIRSWYACPGVEGNIANVAVYSDRYVISFWGGDPTGANGYEKVVLANKDYLEINTGGGGALGRAPGEQLNQLLNVFNMYFTGSISQKSQTSDVLEKAFNFQQFFTQQYKLAPALGKNSADYQYSINDPDVSYPQFILTGTADQHYNQSTVIKHKSATHFVCSPFGVVGGFKVTAIGLSTPTSINIKVCGYSDTLVITDLPINLNTNPFIVNNGTDFQYFPEPISPELIKIEIADIGGATFGNNGGSITVEILQQVAYLPDTFDAYTLLRLGSTTGVDDEHDSAGWTYEYSRLIWDNYNNYGIIKNVSNNSFISYSASAININPMYESMRKFIFDNLRMLPRTQLKGYTVNANKSVLTFQRNVMHQSPKGSNTFNYSNYPVLIKERVGQSFEIKESANLVNKCEYIISKPGSDLISSRAANNSFDTFVDTSKDFIVHYNKLISACSDNRIFNAVGSMDGQATNSITLTPANTINNTTNNLIFLGGEQATEEPITAWIHRFNNNGIYIHRLCWKPAISSINLINTTYKPTEENFDIKNGCVYEVYKNINGSNTLIGVTPSSLYDTYNTIKLKNSTLNTNIQGHELASEFYFFDSSEITSTDVYTLVIKPIISKANPSLKVYPRLNFVPVKLTFNTDGMGLADFPILVSRIVNGVAENFVPTRPTEGGADAIKYLKSDNAVYIDTFAGLQKDPYSIQSIDYMAFRRDGITSVPITSWNNNVPAVDGELEFVLGSDNGGRKSLLQENLINSITYVVVGGTNGISYKTYDANTDSWITKGVSPGSTFIWKTNAQNTQYSDKDLEFLDTGKTVKSQIYQSYTNCSCKHPSINLDENTGITVDDTEKYSNVISGINGGMQEAGQITIGNITTTAYLPQKYYLNTGKERLYLLSHSGVAYDGGVFYITAPLGEYARINNNNYYNGDQYTNDTGTNKDIIFSAPTVNVFDVTNEVADNSFDFFTGMAGDYFSEFVVIPDRDMKIGQTYIVKGETGSGIKYDLSTVETTVDTGGSFSWTVNCANLRQKDNGNKAAIYQENGIMENAPPTKFSNEWSMFISFNHYKDSESSNWKTDNYGDVMPFLHNRCHTDSPEIGYDPYKNDMRKQFSYGIRPIVVSEAPSGYTYLRGINNHPSRNPNFYKSCQIYPELYQIESVKYSSDLTNVEITLKNRLTHCPGEPYTINGPGNNMTYVGPYRTDENGIREYLRYAGGSYQCKTSMSGDVAANSNLYQQAGNAPSGCCHPRIYFIKNIPKVYEDNNDTDEIEHDTKLTAYPFTVMEYYMRAMAGGYTDLQSVSGLACDYAYATSPIADYTFENLCYQALRSDSSYINATIEAVTTNNYRVPTEVATEYIFNASIGNTYNQLQQNIVLPDGNFHGWENVEPIPVKNPLNENIVDYCVVRHVFPGPTSRYIKFRVIHKQTGEIQSVETTASHYIKGVVDYIRYNFLTNTVTDPHKYNVYRIILGKNGAVNSNWLKVASEYSFSSANNPPCNLNSNNEFAASYDAAKNLCEIGIARSTSGNLSESSIKMSFMFEDTYLIDGINENIAAHRISWVSNDDCSYDLERKYTYDGNTINDWAIIARNVHSPIIIPFESGSKEFAVDVTDSVTFSKSASPIDTAYLMNGAGAVLTPIIDGTTITGFYAADGGIGYADNTGDKSNVDVDLYYNQAIDDITVSGITFDSSGRITNTVGSPISISPQINFSSFPAPTVAVVSKVRNLNSLFGTTITDQHIITRTFTIRADNTLTEEHVISPYFNGTSFLDEEIIPEQFSKVTYKLYRNNQVDFTWHAPETPQPVTYKLKVGNNTSNELSIHINSSNITLQPFEPGVVFKTLAGPPTITDFITLDVADVVNYDKYIFWVEASWGDKHQDTNYRVIATSKLRNRWFSMLPMAVRADIPRGFGTLPTTFIYAEIFNYYARTLNLLTTARVELPINYKQRQGYSLTRDVPDNQVVANTQITSSAHQLGGDLPLLTNISTVSGYTTYYGQDVNNWVDLGAENMSATQWAGIDGDVLKNTGSFPNNVVKAWYQTWVDYKLDNTVVFNALPDHIKDMVTSKNIQIIATREDDVSQIKLVAIPGGATTAGSLCDGNSAGINEKLYPYLMGCFKCWGDLTVIPPDNCLTNNGESINYAFLNRKVLQQSSCVMLPKAGTLSAGTYSGDATHIRFASNHSAPPGRITGGTAWQWNSTYKNIQPFMLLTVPLK